MTSQVSSKTIEIGYRTAAIKNAIIIKNETVIQEQWMKYLILIFLVKIYKTTPTIDNPLVDIMATNT